MVRCSRHVHTSQPSEKKFPSACLQRENIDDFWEADSVVFTSAKNYNDVFPYVLACIDVLSKFVWIEPMRTKTASETKHAFQKILNRSKPRHPVCIRVDRGREFLGKSCREFLESKNIAVREARNPDIKCSVIERWIRTGKQILARYLTHARTWRWIDILPQIVDTCNRAKHRATKFSPVSVTLYNAEETRNNIAKTYKQVWVNQRTNVLYKPGDLVRISLDKGTFQKGYTRSFSEEIFRVVRVSQTSKSPAFWLQDLQGENLDCFFYGEELCGVEEDLEKERFEIQEILETKGVGASKQ